jgi:hypothetical protein
MSCISQNRNGSRGARLCRESVGSGCLIGRSGGGAGRRGCHVALTVLHHRTRSAEPLVGREIVAVISQKLPGVRGIPLSGEMAS